MGCDSGNKHDGLFAGVKNASSIRFVRWKRDLWRYAAAVVCLARVPVAVRYRHLYGRPLLACS